MLKVEGLRQVRITCCEFPPSLKLRRACRALRVDLPANSRGVPHYRFENESLGSGHKRKAETGNLK